MSAGTILCLTNQICRGWLTLPRIHCFCFCLKTCDCYLLALQAADWQLEIHLISMSSFFFLICVLCTEALYNKTLYVTNWFKEFEL